MKKINLLALGLCMAALFSCGKDDSDTPGGGANTEKVKISAIWEHTTHYYEESTNGGNSWHVIGSEYQDEYKEKSLSWDGNRLSCITEHYSFGGEYNYNFLYNEDGRISEIIYGDIKLEVEYDDNRISRIGDSDEYMYVTYSNDKITKMGATDDGENHLFELEFEWSGDNLTKSAGYYDDEMDFVSRFQSYDNGNNPYYGQDWALPYLLLSDDYEYWAFKLSANNCTSSNIVGVLVTYEYSYNSKNYPTVVVETWTSEPSEYDGVLHRSKHARTYTYEYVD